MTLQQVIVLALQVSIVMMVFTFGLQATFDDLLYVVRRPSLLVRSLVSMLVIMPIIAVALAWSFALRPSVEIALVALAISPIPPLVPGRQEKAGGSAPYALGLMVLVGVLSIATVPVTADLFDRIFHRPFAMSSGAIANIVLKAAVLPLAAGLVCRAMLPALAARITKPLSRVATLLLAAGALGLLAGVLPAALALIGNGTILALAAFAGVGFAVGHWLGGPTADHRLVLAIATASRHPAIALAVAKANFPDEPNLGAAILLYLLVSLIIGIPYQTWQKRQTALESRP